MIRTLIFAMLFSQLASALQVGDLVQVCHDSNVSNWERDSANSGNGATGVSLEQTYNTVNYNAVSVPGNIVPPARITFAKSQEPNGQLIKALQSTAYQNHTIDPTLEDQFSEFLESFKRFQLRYFAGSWLGPVLCGSLDVVCMSAFHKGMNLANSSANFADYLSFPDIMKQLHDDQRYSKAAALLSLKIIERIQDARADGNSLSYGNLYDDTYSSFISVGASPQEASQYVINLLSLYGMRGSENETFLTIPFRYSDGAFTPFESMTFIAKAINYLDLAKLKNGNLYSLPASARTRCEYSRPYHFWMAASLANELIKSGYSAGVAFKAVHKISLAYELVGSTGNKQATNVFTIDSYLKETQKNFAFNDAGAFWIASKMGQDISVDNMLTKIMNSEKQNIPDWAKEPGALLGAVKATAVPYWIERTGSEANVSDLEKKLGRWLIR